MHNSPLSNLSVYEVVVFWTSLLQTYLLAQIFFCFFRSICFTSLFLISFFIIYSAILASILDLGHYIHNVLAVVSSGLLQISYMIFIRASMLQLGRYIHDISMLLLLAFFRYLSLDWVTFLEFRREPFIQCIRVMEYFMLLTNLINLYAIYPFLDKSWK